MKASDIKLGNFIKYNNELVQIIEFQHRTPGNLRAFYSAKMRNVKSGRLAEYRFRVDEEVDIVRVETRNMQFLYKDGESFVCMDPVSYDQTPIDSIMFGDSARFMKEGMEVIVSFDNNEAPVMAQPPFFVEMEVTYSEPGIKGDTVNNVLKPATLENGVEIRVPMFVSQGDFVKVDTRTGEYVERVKK
jgi:elongation factor P